MRWRSAVLEVGMLGGKICDLDLDGLPARRHRPCPAAAPRSTAVEEWLVIALAIRDVASQHGRGRFIRPKRASPVNKLQAAASSRSSLPGLPHSSWKAASLKASSAAKLRSG